MLIDILRWVMLAWCILFVAAIFFLNYKLPVEGANDNLTGTFGSIAILKYLKDNDISFEHTEVIAMVAGSEESGLRGSKAYMKAHGEELKDVPTVFIGLETFRDYEDIAIYERDMTGTVKMDSGCCTLMKKAGLEAGLDLPFNLSKADMKYPGSTISVTVTPDGKVVELVNNLPMEGTGAAKLLGREVYASFAGALDETWTFTY